MNMLTLTLVLPLLATGVPTSESKPLTACWLLFDTGIVKTLMSSESMCSHEVRASTTATWIPAGNIVNFTIRWSDRTTTWDKIRTVHFSVESSNQTTPLKLGDSDLYECQSQIGVKWEEEGVTHYRSFASCNNELLTASGFELFKHQWNVTFEVFHAGSGPEKWTTMAAGRLDQLTPFDDVDLRRKKDWKGGRLSPTGVILMYLLTIGLIVAGIINAALVTQKVSARRRQRQ